MVGTQQHMERIPNIACRGTAEMSFLTWGR
jgi:hypothetical protein